MTNYLLESSVCLGVMLLLYRLLLAKTTLHQIKRVFLLACLVIPLAWPLVSVDIYYEQGAIATLEENSPRWTGLSALEEQLSPEPVESIIEGQSEVIQKEPEQANQSINWITIAIFAYSLVTGALLIRLLVQLGSIKRLAQQSENKYYQDYRLVLLEKMASPYSFFRYIFMGKPDFEVSAVKQQLIAHELVHVKQWHSLDVLLIEFCKAIFWFNPMYWLLGKSMRLNHEFIADAGVIANVGNKHIYQNLLLQFYQRPRVSSPLVSPSDFSFIKNRFQMMQKTTRKKTAALRMLLLIPVLGGVLFSFAMDLKPKPKVDSIPTLEETTYTAPANPPTGFPIEGVKDKIYTWYSLDDRIVWKPEDKTDAYPGLDMTSSPNRVVIATGDGKVTQAQYDDKRYGHYIMVDHENGFKTLYASLNQINVKVGESVIEGQKLGLIGTSMEVSNLPKKVHRVHYAIREHDKWINPAKYLKTQYQQTAKASDAKRKIINPADGPDMVPFDTNSGGFMAYTGSMGGNEPKANSIYDSVLGTEFFLLPDMPINATEAGTVTEVVQGHKKYGNYVKITHRETLETMYARLENIVVKKGEKVKKGQHLGNTGHAADMYSRMHYKIKINDRLSFPKSSLYGNRAGYPAYRGLSKKKSPKPAYGILDFHISWNFESGFIFKSILYDREKAVFVKASGEAITKKASELTKAQKGALLSLRAKPYDTHVVARPVPEEVYSRWEKPWVYKIFIDGKHIESKEMVNYKPEDFAHSSWVVVSKNIKERFGHAFELYLQTPDYFEQQKKDRKQRYADWKKYTRQVLSSFNDF